ncbi:hypothetical protein ONS95_013236 [Cadophora gregata]|uniref:uncharacterized protein n=1 Tax=Cadophora gregata TaxID=51156 RepID=UPI0026DC6B7B|nr:uncharacterized protein ONS95_013236 [Cadophora gregata]KAK0099941.1 hypothetical protein ONS96_007887 [Cadophora gregata f. sp. sojae]KAK0116207.1 hypothetical protein ONS95_013236 [Cadophora gregata]
MMDFNGHVVSSDAAVTSKSGVRLRRSCEACRSSKGRCISSPDDPHRCLRCVKDGKRCVFLEAKPRPKRAKNSRMRVAEMEEKLEGLLALVAANATNQPAKETLATATQLLTAPEMSSILRPDTNLIDLNSAYATPSSLSNQSEQSIPQQQSMFVYPIFDNLQDAISKGFISLDQADYAFEVFRQRQRVFPFVVIPPNMTLDSLRRQRPFLFLAILCCATEHNFKLQQHIELELRENLSRRILVNGEKTLDLLQGVLVYLTWYHFYFNPDREQMYQLSQIAISMTVDLGMDKPTRQGQTCSGTSSLLPFMSQSMFSAGEIEGMRAYLGCYFLTSSICQGLRRPSHMKYNQHIKSCVQHLSDAAIADSDQLIPYFIRLRQISDETNQAFNHDFTPHLSQLDSIRTEILGRAFEQQLDHLEGTFPKDIWDNSQIKMSFLHLRIYVNEVGFHASAPSDSSVLSDLALSSWYHSPARNDCLLRCLRASKLYLDTFLSLSDSVISSMVTVDLLQLVYAVLVLGTFASSIDAPSLDQNQVRQSANLDYYLRSISDRYARLICIQDPLSNSYKHHMNTLFQTSKAWYLQTVTDPSPSGPPRFLFNDIIGTITGRCAEFTVPEPMSEMDSDSQWTELLSEWASSVDPSAVSFDETLL